MTKGSWTPVWIQSTLIAVGAILLMSLLATLADPVKSAYLLPGTMSVFLHWLPAAFITGFILTFNLRLDSAWLESGTQAFLSRLLFLAAISGVVVAMNIFLFQPAVNSALDQSMEAQALTSRISRQTGLYEEELALGVDRQDISTESILAAYRRDINRRISILAQLENLYTIQARLVPEKENIVDRMDSIRAQLEEQQKNLRRLPRIETERQLLWSDFTNLTSASSLLLAQELFTKRQWPECYQIASLAVMLGETTGAAERLRESSRQELLKVPVADGEFFRRKARVIALYQAGLYREAYYGLSQLEGEGLVDDEIVKYLQLSREQVQSNYVFVESAQLGLDVPIASPVFWTQHSAGVPGASEWISARWLSLSRLGYLLMEPRILRRGSGGEWQSWQADYARVTADPARPGKMMIDFRFLYERVNQLQDASPGMPFNTLPLDLDRETATMLADSRLRPETLSFFQLFPLMGQADGLGSNDAAFQAEMQMRIWSVPIYFTSVFFLVFLSLYLHAREGKSIASQFTATAVAAGGLFLAFDILHWAARVLLGGLARNTGMTVTGVASGLAVALALGASLILLVRTAGSYSSGTR